MYESVILLTKKEKKKSSYKSYIYDRETYVCMYMFIHALIKKVIHVYY